MLVFAIEYQTILLNNLLLGSCGCLTGRKNVILIVCSILLNGVIFGITLFVWVPNNQKECNLLFVCV